MTTTDDDVSRETSTVEIGPAPVMRGDYSIYETPGGGYHLAYTTDDSQETQHFDVPGQYIKMFGSMGNLRGFMGRVLGKFGGN